MAVVLFSQYRFGNQGFLNLTTKASKSIRNRKVHTLPTMSPCDTKKVMSLRSGIFPCITAFFHHCVSSIISPDGLIIAEIPVFAHLAIALRVSIARRHA